MCKIILNSNQDIRAFPIKYSFVMTLRITSDVEDRKIKFGDTGKELVTGNE